MNNKAFTLAELLIVTSIISVLTGVSIPVFNSQLEKSRESKDLANVRNTYAEMMTDAMVGDSSSGYWNASEKQYKAVVKLGQQKEDWQGTKDLTIAGISSSDSWRWRGHPMAEGFCEITYDPTSDVLVFDWAGSNLLTNITYESGSWSGSEKNAGKRPRDGDHPNDIFSSSNKSSTPSGVLKGLYELDGNSKYKVTVTYNPYFDDQDNPTMGVFAKATLLYDSNGKPVFDSGTGTTFEYNKEIIIPGKDITYKYTKNKDGTITYTATFSTGSDLEKYYYGMNFGGMAVNFETGVINNEKSGVRKFTDSNGFGLSSSEAKKLKEQVVNNLILEKLVNNYLKKIRECAMRGAFFYVKRCKINE